MSVISGSGFHRNLSLSLAGPTSIMTARITERCLPLYIDWPHLNLNLIITDTEDRLRLVRSGEADLVIVPPETIPNEMDSKALKPDKYVLVGTKRWKGRKLHDILTNERLIDFYESDQTSLNYLKKFGHISALGRPRMFANNNDVIIRLFKQGVGFGTLTQEIANPHVESGELITLNGGAIMEDPLALAWYPRPEMPPYLRAVISAVR
jgi:DNA-binding transcriptional LysR family regulator